MSGTNAQLFGGLGGPELILVAAIVLLLAVAPRLFARDHGRWTETAAARAYLDRLLGPAPPLFLALGELPGLRVQPIRSMVATRGQVLRAREHI